MNGINLLNDIDLAGAKIVPKAESFIMKAFGVVLSLLGNKKFMRDYWTTLGKTIYYPTHTINPYLSREIIEHELIHVKQYKKYGPLMWIAYLFLPVPIFFAWFRWRLEREAYLVNIKEGMDINYIVYNLWYGYLYPWPRSWMLKWFMDHSTRPR